MIEITTNTGTVKLHNAWDELTPTEFAAVCLVVHNTQQGKLSLHEARMGIMQALTGYKRSRKRLSKEAQQQINDNLSVLAAELNFVFLPAYRNPELLEVLSPELRKQLLTTFPFEIRDSQHVKQLTPMAGLLDYGIKINLLLNRNPMPAIEVDKIAYHGPVWHVDNNNILTTDLVADEYIDALDYYKLYTRTRQENYLHKLTSVLYRPNREGYAEGKLVEVKATQAQHVAVYYLFQAIQEYLHARSAWSMLFASENDGQTEPQPHKISLGMIENLYSLSKEGYGSREQMGKLNLKELLNLILKQIKDTVAALKANKMKDHEIAANMHMPIHIIQML